MAETPSHNTFWIDLDLVDIPPDARSHTEEDIADMARQLKDEGQLQNIIVARKGGRYEVVAGVRRTRGARKLVWTQIRADVRDSLSDYERKDIMFSENEGRVEANPLYQARLLKGMLDASGLTQAEFAKKRGKTAAWLSQYLGLLDLPEEAIRILTMVKISMRAARAIKALPSQELQVRIAGELQEKKIGPESVLRRAKQLTREVSFTNKPGSASTTGAAAGSQPTVQAASPGGQGNIPTLPAGRQADQAGLPADNDESHDYYPFEFSTSRNWADVRVEAVYDRRDGMEDFIDDFRDKLAAWLESKEGSTYPCIRLPETPEEWKELEDLAAASPGPVAVFGWIKGKDDPSAQPVKGDNWEFMKIKESPRDWVHRLVTIMRQFDLPKWDHRYLQLPNGEVAEPASKPKVMENPRHPDESNGSHSGNG